MRLLAAVLDRFWFSATMPPSSFDVAKPVPVMSKSRAWVYWIVVVAASLLMSSCESIPTAFNMASTARPVAADTGEFGNSRRTLPSHPAALASATKPLAASGSYLGPGTAGYHVKSFWRSSEPGLPLPLWARWSITLGSTAAATALRTRRSLVGGFDGVGPSGFPVHC